MLELVGDRAAVGVAQPGKASASVSPGTKMCSSFEGIWAISSGFSPISCGSSAGSPGGVEPSGSSDAARWPCVRSERTSAFAVAAAWSRRGRPVRARRPLPAPAPAPAPVARAGRSRCPVDRYVVVEALLAGEQCLDAPEEAARLGALDDAVVVGRGQRHHALGADPLADLGEARREADRARRDDRPLPLHQARHGRGRSEAARVGQAGVRRRRDRRRSACSCGPSRRACRRPRGTRRSAGPRRRGSPGPSVSATRLAAARPPRGRG